MQFYRNYAGNQTYCWTLGFISDWAQSAESTWTYHLFTVSLMINTGSFYMKLSFCFSILVIYKYSSQ